MNKRLFKTSLALAMLAGMHVQSAQAFVPGVYFTEALIDAASGYWFIEVTNLSGASVSSLGFDDSSRGLVLTENLETGFFEMEFDETSLLSLGSLSNGQSAIITNACPNLTCKNNNGQEVFANLWPQLTSPSFKVIQTTNVAQYGIQVPEEMNLYSGDVLLDRVLVTSANAGASVQPLPEDLGQNHYNNWALSDVSDDFGSYRSSVVGLVQNTDVGTPGFYEITAVPEPETYAMMLAGLGLVGLVARKRKAANRIHA